MLPETDNSVLKKLLEKNTELLEDNNRLLRKIRSYEVWGFWTRVVWYVLIIGLPLAVYYYFLQPYFELVGSNYETFEAGMKEIPGWKQFYDAMESFKD